MAKAVSAHARALLTIAEKLEWHSRRHGCAPFPNGQPLTARCCPSCYGIDPSQDALALAEMFPASHIGHRDSCGLKQEIDQLREEVLSDAR